MEMLIIGIIRYAVWLALGGLVAGVSLFVRVIYTRRRALMELVRTVEIVKPYLSGENNRILFGESHSDICRLQSDSTKKLVRKERVAYRQYLTKRIEADARSKLKKL